ncbi:MAG: circularly permuted type 2 ATP-grasp protein [Alphaproteobacteria bacterium]|nr:circularly permuted type 2 ATP-grasp protein [Alphaproteobacteria bacterium]
MTGFALDGYDPQQFYCEMLRCTATAVLGERLKQLPIKELTRRAANAEQAMYNFGITFTVYSDANAIDRILPFDAIPRVIAIDEWRRIETGVIQRVTALNLLLHDIYHEQKIIKDGVLPADLILGNSNYRPQMQGVDLPHKAYVNICGTDIIRGGDGEFRVLEDNARTPSGVSYVIENRHMMLRAFPDLVNGLGLRPVDEYGSRLAAAMRELAPQGCVEPQIVLLSPGVYNSAYFEHVFLAREMGVPLVEGRDLVVDNDRVFMRTIAGLHRVDVIYRRINDDFLDPEAFRPDSALGVSGLMRAYNKGNVGLANAIGTGVADDKAVYAYMPRIIRYYLSEEAILPNVDTRLCRESEGLAYTLANLERLVVKPVGEAGGYGITIGPKASRAELDDCREKLIADPSNYISQPCIDLSVSPTLIDGRVVPRHVDLRPFAVTGASTWVLPGGLTRVALKEGSLIVNSSQGGGSKDTWVLE